MFFSYQVPFSAEAPGRGLFDRIQVSAALCLRGVDDFVRSLTETFRSNCHDFAKSNFAAEKNSRPFKNVLFAVRGKAAYKNPSGIGLRCRSGALTGRLFQRADREAQHGGLAIEPREAFGVRGASTLRSSATAEDGCSRLRIARLFATAPASRTHTIGFATHVRDPQRIPSRAAPEIWLRSCCGGSVIL